MATLAQKREELIRKYETELIEARIEDIEGLEVPFFNEPITLCGIDFRPVTLHMLRDLFAARNPYVCKGDTDFADTFITAWYLSVHYNGSLIKRAWLWWRWRGKDVGELSEAVKTVIGYALRGAPKGSASSDESPQYSWMAGIVHRLASAYGWSQKEILSLTAGSAWQYYRIIREEEAAKIGKRTPLSAGKYEAVMAKYLKELNEIEAQILTDSTAG